MDDVHVISHPLIQHKLTLMRERDTPTGEFRNLMAEVAMLLAYEVTRTLPLGTKIVQTPLTRTEAPVLEGKKVVIVSILRAGEGLALGILRLIPSARVGHIGMYRDPATLQPIEYYFKVPAQIDDRDVLVVDPMLATGNSASAAVDRLKRLKPRSLKFVCLLAAPEGIASFHAKHPDVPIFTASVDEGLNEHGYIVPGLGDAGDRMFGTR